METPAAAPPPPNRALIIDDELGTRRTVIHLLERNGLSAAGAETAEAALETLETTRPDVIILDWHLPGMDGFAALQHFTDVAPDIPVIMLTIDSDVEKVKAALNQGAFEYLTKPVDPPRLVAVITSALRFRSQLLAKRSLENTLNRVAQHETFSEILSCSPAMKPVFRLMERVMNLSLPVLIQGESGTGKELVAQAIHSRGKRRRGPFVALNCAALPESLVESELFGHERGAFTGAATARPGHVELADGGTFFLDEVGELPLSIQPKFLRCLQDGVVRRVGASKTSRVDFRLISATNRNLEEEVREGRFREDLFYRLAVFPIRLPPLRERREDILLLARHFLAQTGRESMRFDADAERVMHEYPWPGNVRELQNLMARLAVLVEGDRVTGRALLDHLPPEFGRSYSAAAGSLGNLHAAESSPDEARAASIQEEEEPDFEESELEGGEEPGLAPAEHQVVSIYSPPTPTAGRIGVGSAPLRSLTPPPRRITREQVLPLAEVERLAIEEALIAYEGNVTDTARALGIGRATLYRYVRKHNLLALIRRR